MKIGHRSLPITLSKFSKIFHMQKNCENTPVRIYNTHISPNREEYQINCYNVEVEEFADSLSC